MAGVLSGSEFNTGKFSRFGYVTLTGGRVFGRETGNLPAHEFHYYDTTENGRGFRAEKPLGARGWDCMISTDTLLAGFPHLYYYGNPRLAEAFLEKCMERKKTDESAGNNTENNRA